MMDKSRRPEILSRPVAQYISVSLGKTQSFSYTYPQEAYHFPTAYVGSATLEELTFHVKIGISEVRVYGKKRGKIFIFLDNYPGTEFVETDTTGLYASQVKAYRANWRNLRPGEPLPTPFTSFVVRSMRDLITGPYVPYAQAVLVHSEDLATMVRFAFIKRLYKERGAEPARTTESQDNSSISAEEQFRRKALEVGLLREFRRSDYQPSGDRTPVAVIGKPLSQEIIEERR